MFRKILCLLLLCCSAAFSEPVEEAEEGFEPNRAGFYVGGTGEGRRENGLTLGLKYERRLKESFGVGAEVERVLGQLDFWVFVVPLAYHKGPWTFFAGPGIEDQDDADAEFLMRIGGEYGFEVGNWEIAPGVAFDFVDGDAEIIVGALFTWGF